MTRARPVVAIDGPAGAGKSTCARMLAERLGFVLVDTGALYRSVALAARERGVAWSDAEGLGRLTERLELTFTHDSLPRLCIDGVDRSKDIRTPEISMGASDVSKHPQVRTALLGLQRRLGADGGVVLEGRDIGTVVFPDAELKVFLTASPEERARRRTEELRARGVAADFAETLAEIVARDKQDSERTIAPLKPAPDAVIVDSTAMTLEAVVDELEREARARARR